MTQWDLTRLVFTAVYVCFLLGRDESVRPSVA